MKVIAINGSPRKKWNTATLLTKALEGAASVGAETELIHLYDLTYKGCVSCFACKMVGGPHYGHCAVKDDLTPIYSKIEKDIDVLILGSPIYFDAVTGEMRSFMERLLFPSLIYSHPPASAFPRKIRTGFVYTMNVGEDTLAERGYNVLFNSAESILRFIFGSAETLCAFDTLQFPDPSKVIMEYMDPAKKKDRHEKVFPEDCRRAFEFGVRLATPAGG